MDEYRLHGQSKGECPGRIKMFADECHAGIKIMEEMVEKDNGAQQS